MPVQGTEDILSYTEWRDLDYVCKKLDRTKSNARKTLNKLINNWKTVEKKSVRFKNNNIMLYRLIQPQNI